MIYQHYDDDSSVYIIHVIEIRCTYMLDLFYISAYSCGICYFSSSYNKFVCMAVCQVVDMIQTQRDCRSPSDQRSPLPNSSSFDVRLTYLLTYLLTY